VPAHRPVDADLLRRARLAAGDPDRLTLTTARNREERTAVRRAQYLGRRVARPTATARTALGHAPPGSAGPRGTFFAVPEGGGEARLLVGVAISQADIHRVGRYDSLVGQLAAGRLSGRAFERRIRAWRPVDVLGPPEFAGRYLFVSDPGTALRLRQQADDEGIETWIDSGRMRPRPRRRSTRRAS
jgi:hypothetical protein